MNILKRGDVYRSIEVRQQRGDKTGYYVVVSREYVTSTPRIRMVMCAPIYSERLGVATEILVDERNGIDHPSSLRCDFIMTLRKEALTRRVGALDHEQMRLLRPAIVAAFGLDEDVG